MTTQQNKNSFFIDVDKRLSGTFVQFIGDEASSGEVQIEFVPLGTSVTDLMPMSFGRNTVVTPWTVASEDYHWLEPTQPDEQVRDGYVGRILLVQRSDGGWGDKRLDDLQSRVDTLKEKNKDLRTEVESLKRKNRKLSDEKEKEAQQGKKRVNRPMRKF